MVLGVGAGFVVYVSGSLYATEAHVAGLKSSDFHAETVAMSLGLTTLTSLTDSYFDSSIRLSVLYHNSFQSSSPSI